MAHPVIFRIDKLGTRGNVAGSGNHNYRERETLNADPDRLTKNQHTGATSTAELFAAMDARIAQLDEVDPQAVPLVEMLVTAAHEAFREGGGGHVNSKALFDDAVAWAEEKFGKQNVIATTRHYDELTPHLVMYVVPVREIEAKTRKRSVIVGKDPETGKQLRETREYPMPARSILSAKHWFDGGKKLSNLQTEFAALVGAKHGLIRGVEGSRAKHVTVKEFYANLQRPIVPIPNPPTITGTNWLKANKLLAEYEQQLNAALVPLQARARDRDNQTARRSDPTDRARADAAEALNERNQKQIEHLRALLADAGAQVAVGHDQIAQLQAEIERLTLEMAEVRRVADAQQTEIERLKGSDLDYDPLAHTPL